MLYPARALLLTLLALPSLAQRIEITRIPPYGKNGVLEGRVSGIDPSRVSVILFSHVKGFTIQPGCPHPTIQPGGTGSFSVHIEGDPKITHYAALLVPSDFVPRCPSNEAGIPRYIQAQSIASDFRIRPQPGEKVIHWSGFEFAVREWAGGPGNCIYDKRNVNVDHAGRLHLAVKRRKGVYTCAEVVLTRSLGGYGTYTLRVASRMATLSPAVVFGAFTYGSFSPEAANREIDFAEVSKWGGDAKGPTYAQFVVQPAGTEGNFHRFPLASPQPTFETSWRPDAILFRAYPGSSGSPVEWNHPGSFRPLDQTVHLNLWTYAKPGSDSEIILDKLSFKPMP